MLFRECHITRKQRGNHSVLLVIFRYPQPFKSLVKSSIPCSLPQTSFRPSVSNSWYFRGIFFNTALIPWTKYICRDALRKAASTILQSQYTALGGDRLDLGESSFFEGIEEFRPERLILTFCDSPPVISWSIARLRGLVRDSSCQPFSEETPRDKQVLMDQWLCISFLQDRVGFRAASILQSIRYVTQGGWNEYQIL